nr:MAG: hypothetical protein [Bacteriophage sp.]
MAGRLYRMAKVVSANPKSWGIVDANEISGFKRVAKLSDLYSIAECILSSSYGDGVTDGADAVGQIWHVSETNGDYKLTNWANRKSAAGWTKLSYGGDVSVPVRDVHVNDVSVLSNGVAKIDLTPYAKTTTTNTLTNNVNGLQRELNNTNATVGALSGKVSILESNIKDIDTTVYEVIGDKPLPTTGIKKRIYLKLIETGDPTGDNNKYAEYVYTEDPEGTYDATKWEKLGEVAAKTDLSEYYKKTEIDTKVDNLNNADIKNFTITPSFRGEQGAGKLYYMQASITRKGGDPLSATIPCVVSAADTTNANAGLMSPADKQKLDGIAVEANKYTHPHYTAASEGLYKISVDTFGHIFTTNAVKKEDITKLGIPGSAPTVDAAMSDTSTNAVQNKVIDSAIKTHSVNQSNFKNVTSKTPSRLLFYSELMDGINHKYLKGEGFVVKYIASDIPNVYYTKDGTSNDAKLLYDTDMTALTDEELIEILK